MKIKAIRCPRCKDVIYSRARHDYRQCGCGLIGVDGGFDYWKVTMKTHPGKPFATWKIGDMVKLDLDVTRDELYKDWNKGIDKYGIIKED